MPLRSCTFSSPRCSIRPGGGGVVRCLLAKRRWLDRISAVDEFLRRSRLQYRELLDLIQVRYVHSGSSLGIISTDANHPDTCDTSKLKLNALDAGIAGRIVRFVRLWRKLGWTMFDLDRVITALDGDLTIVKFDQLLDQGETDPDPLEFAA